MNKVCVVIAAALFLSACVDPNKHALEIGAPAVIEGKTIVSMREIQSHNYSTIDNANLVQASAATLQDLGFTVSEVSKEFGVLVGTKERDAKEAGQITGQAILMVLAALAGSSHTMTYDETQKINVTILVHQIDSKSSQVRAFFDRHITNNHGQLWKAQLITDAEIYKQFFEKLSKSAFLEGNQQ
ncbi:MAG: hypothetical protein VW802_06740 [Rhodospirillaceae bacterium]|jgi:hypothetical protein